MAKIFFGSIRQIQVNAFQYFIREHEMPQETDFDECYKILSLTPGVPLQQIEEQVKLLRLAWHPDKFKEQLRNNPRLMKQAEEKLAIINAAFDDLRSYWRTY